MHYVLISMQYSDESDRDFQVSSGRASEELSGVKRKKRK